MGPCMCGDIRCGSCGPAQGNHKCWCCGKWDDEGGCIDPKACDKKMAAERQDDLKRELAEVEAEPADTCPHGNPWHDCSNCLTASDLAYEREREDRAMGRIRI